MLGFFERQRLVKKGLASSKIRRRRTESELVQTLEYGVISKLAVFGGFLVCLWGLIYSDSRQQPTQGGLIAVLIFLTALAQLWINHPNTFARNSRILLMFGIFLLHLSMVKFMLVTGDSQVLRASVDDRGMFTGLQLQQLWRLAIPFAFAPLTLSVLLGKNHGIYAATFVSLWGSIIYRGIDARFLVISLITGFIAVFVTIQVRRRSRLIRAGLFVGLATWMLALIFGWIGPISWESFSETQWRLIGWQSLFAIGGRDRHSLRRRRSAARAGEHVSHHDGYLVARARRSEPPAAEADDHRSARHLSSQPRGSKSGGSRSGVRRRERHHGAGLLLLSRHRKVGEA
jgi:hypothetical protein